MLLCGSVKRASGMREQLLGQPVIFRADRTLIDDVNDKTSWEKHIGPSFHRSALCSATAYSPLTTTNP
jgi:hypothetical protein